MEQLSALLWSACLYEQDQKWLHIFIMHLELVSVYISNVECGVEFKWLFLRWGTTTHADTCTVSVSPYIPFRVSLNSQNIVLMCTSSYRESVCLYKMFLQITCCV